MNVTSNVAFGLLAQANAAAVPKSFFSWVYETLGTFHGLVTLWVGIIVFAGACFVVAKSRRPSVIASYLVLLPSPLIVAVYGALAGQISSLAVLSTVPVQVSGTQIAAGVAAGLVPLFVALTVTWPSYLVLAIGLIVRVVQGCHGSDATSRCFSTPR